MCLMISAELVSELMEDANAALESGDAGQKQTASEKIQAVLEGVTEEYMHYSLLENYCKALAN
ncbi:MAG: hypothetical protein K6B42_03825 [Clostridia bacterium]|nr:hypothetical protein [Clostridia bacterium]